MTLKILPHYSFRRMIARKLYHSIAGHTASNPFYNPLNLLHPINVTNAVRYARKRISCNVCGTRAAMLYDFPNIQQRREHRIGLLRETLQCKVCGATMRDRTVASQLLLHVNRDRTPPVTSISELCRQDQPKVTILDTDSFSPISRRMASRDGYVRSSYLPQQPFGRELEPGRYNLNLESIDFPNNHFDIVLTSDVAEHIRNIHSAHSEISRILRHGGFYIFTAPYDPECPTHHVLVDTTSSNDEFLVPKQIHGDPLTGGVLAYRVFGQKLFSDLAQVGLTAEFRTVHEPSTGIWDGDIFIAQKRQC